MNNSKLIRILKTFSESEIKSFSKYLDSPLFGCKPYVVKFFSVLKKFHPEFNVKNISKETIFNKLYPGKEYDDSVIRKIISYTLIYLEDFMIIQGLSNNRIKRNELLLEQYIDRLLPVERDNLINENLKYLKQELEKNPGLINHYTEAVMNKMGYDWLNLEKKNKQAIEVEYANAVTDNILYILLEGYYQINAARKRLNYSEVTGLDLIVKHTNLPALINEYKSSNSKIYEAVKIEYFIASIYIQDESDKHYPELKKLVFKKLREFEDELSERLFQKMQNFCVVKINEGNDNFRQELFELYNYYFYHSGKYFSDDYLIHPLLFRNAFKSALSISKIKWAEKFLNDFKKYIEPKFRDSFNNFFMAELKFEMKEFEESLNYHSKINFDAVVQKFDYKLLQLKLYYELGYYEEALYTYDSVRHFTKGLQDVAEIQIIYFENSLKYYFKLLNIKAGIDKKTDPGLLQKQLYKEKDIHKTWFEAKLDELKYENSKK